MLILLVLACALGPMGVDMAPAAPPTPPALAPELEIEGEDAAPGSLWSDGSSRVMIGDNNARAVGDLVTIKIDESIVTQLGADTSTGRSSASNFGISALLGVDTSLIEKNPNLGGTIGLGGSSDSTLEGSGTTSRQGSMQTTLTCTVAKVYPNGNIMLAGRKQVGVNNETQYVTLRAIARPRDISLDNTIESFRLADVQVEVTGGGVLANQQNQGWLTSVSNVLWPF